MIIKIDETSGVSIHQQIVQQLEASILSGAIAEGEFLPSVREFAKENLINPNTVSKVYVELQRRGLVSSQRGKGILVESIQKQDLETQKEDLIQKHIVTFVESLSALGIEKKEAIRRIQEGAWK